MDTMERYWGRIWSGMDGRSILPGTTVETLGGKIRKVVSVDKDGYVHLEGEFNASYHQFLKRI